MAVKQNGVLATFTPTVSKYTNLTVAANSNTIAATEYNIYTCPAATLTSGKLVVSNNTGGALNIDVGIVEQTDVIQLAQVFHKFRMKIFKFAKIDVLKFVGECQKIKLIGTSDA